MVALMVLLPTTNADHESDVEETRARFRQECAPAAGLHSPHVVPIHGYRKIDGRLHIAMIRLRGTALGALIRAEGPLLPARAVAIVARALSFAHRAGRHVGLHAPKQLNGRRLDHRADTYALTCVLLRP